MKLKYILLTFLAFFILGAGYYYYTGTINKPETDVWAFVPGHAVWVYETTQGGRVWEGLQEQPAGEIVQQLPFFQRLARYRQQLDSVSGGMLEEFMQGRKLLSSVHITTKNSFDYLFYVPVKGPEDYDLLKRILGAYRKQAAYRYGTRTYHGLELEEFTDPATQKRFSWLLHENYLIGSFTPFLVEDVIRQIDEEGEKHNFRTENRALFQLSQIVTDEGNLYVNGNRLGAFLNLFLRQGAFSPSFPLVSRLDVALKEEGLLLNGYTALDSASGELPYLQSLLGEEPQPLGMAHLLPLRTATLAFYGFKSGAAWHRLLLEQGTIPEWKRLLQQQSEAAVLPQTLGKSVALARWQNPGEKDMQQLLFLELKEPEVAGRQWEQLARSLSEARGDTLYQEVFSEYTITQLPYEGLPKAFLGPAFSGFTESFYVQLGNFLVLGSSIEGIKTLLLDVEGDNTWRKSVPMYQFLERTNQKMNFAYYVNTDQFWKQIIQGAEPEWQAFFEKQGPYLRQFNLFALQLSALDDLFYTNVLLQASPREVKKLQRLQLATLHSTRFDLPLISHPMLVRSSERRSREVLVQDSLYRLHLLDAQGDPLTGDSLQGPLITEVFQLALGRNGQLGYLAVTPEQLYLYDASFQLQPGFPLSLPEGTSLQWANVIDYNGSKIYRLLLADKSGSLFMLDTEGNLLEGWQPRSLDGALSGAPGHIRVRGKDVLYAWQQKGLIQMLNRRGETYQGFPLNLQDSLLGPVVIKPGADFSGTRFTTITKEGELISFNLLGQITGQEQLFKPEAETTFRLVPDAQEQSFLLLRQSPNRLSLLDAEGKLLFEKEYLGEKQLKVQYFIFGADKEIIALTDPQQAFTFLYDAEGNLLNAEPLNSCCPLSIVYLERENTYHIFKSYSKEVSVLQGHD